VWSVGSVDDLLWCWNILLETIKQAIVDGSLVPGPVWSPMAKRIDWLYMNIYVTRAEKGLLKQFVSEMVPHKRNARLDQMTSGTSVFASLGSSKSGSKSKFSTQGESAIATALGASAPSAMELKVQTEQFDDRKEPASEPPAYAPPACTAKDPPPPPPPPPHAPAPGEIEPPGESSEFLGDIKLEMMGSSNKQARLPAIEVGALFQLFKRDLHVGTEMDVYKWLSHDKRLLSGSMDDIYIHIRKLLKYAMREMKDRYPSTDAEEKEMVVSFCGPSALAHVIGKAAKEIDACYEFAADHQ